VLAPSEVDAAAFDHFFLFDYPRLVATLGDVVGDVDVARDAVEDACAQAWDLVQRGRAVEVLPLPAWARRAAAERAAHCSRALDATAVLSAVDGRLAAGDGARRPPRYSPDARDRVLHAVARRRRRRAIARWSGLAMLVAAGAMVAVWVVRGG
jgi:hypothetical protein